MTFHSYVNDKQCVDGGNCGVYMYTMDYGLAVYTAKGRKRETNITLVVTLHCDWSH